MKYDIEDAVYEKRKLKESQAIAKTLRKIATHTYKESLSRTDPERIAHYKHMEKKRLLRKLEEQEAKDDELEKKRAIEQERRYHRDWMRNKRALDKAKFRKEQLARDGKCHICEILLTSVHHTQCAYFDTQLS